MTFPNAVLSSLADHFETLVNGGASPGYIRFSTTGTPGTELARITLQADSMGAATNGVKNINPPNGEAAWLNYEFNVTAEGTAAKAELYDGDDVLLDTFTVGVSGADFNFAAGLTWTVGLVLKCTTTTPQYTLVNG